jgi:hypothetical protein
MQKLIHSSPSTLRAIGDLLRAAVDRDISDLQASHQLEENEESPKTYHPVKTATAIFLCGNPGFKTAFNDFLSISADGAGKRKVGFGMDEEKKSMKPGWRI